MKRNDKLVIQKKQKASQVPKQFCMEMGCMQLLEFSEEIYSYEFKEKPNYKKLRFLLTKELLKQNLFPDDVFVWNQYIKRRKPREEMKISVDLD